MITATLGQLLAGLRSERGLKLREVARLAGIYHTTLSRWEKGTFLPRLPELEAVLTALNATAVQRKEALDQLDAPRALALARQETAQHAPDFAKAAGGVPGDGEMLRAMRLRAGKTLEETARAIGSTATTLSRWERSEMRPDTLHLHALCYALGASEEEVTALTCSDGATSFLPEGDSAAQIATQGLALRLGIWKPPVALTELICFGLEAQAWRLVPQQPEAQTVVFALNYWRMKTLLDTGRYDQAAPYVQRVLALSETLPPTFSVPLLTNDVLPKQIVQAHETHSRALLYRAILAERRTPKAHRTLAGRLAREWRGAYDIYFRAWMMSEAANLMAKGGDTETASDWGRRACEEADTGDAAHWTEVLFRRRDYATLLKQMGRSEEALSLLEASTELNHYSDCRARYHLMRTEIFLDQSRSAQAHDELSQAHKIIQTHQLDFMRSRAVSLQSRF